MVSSIIYSIGFLSVQNVSFHKEAKKLFHLSSETAKKKPTSEVFFENWNCGRLKSHQKTCFRVQGTASI